MNRGTQSHKKKGSPVKKRRRFAKGRITSWLRKFYYYLPPGLRFLSRRLYYAPIDIWEDLTGKRAPGIPPRGMIFTGSGDFIAQGHKLVNFFIEYGRLQPSNHVLDVGSGIGRIALPLTTYLDESARYEGFDAVKYGVRWCQKSITRNYPNFNFQYVPLENDLYRRGGIRPETYSFPYSDDAFDFVAVVSVFTHMLPEELVNYLYEIHRVLKKGGSCFATFFIWNAESERLSEYNEGFQFHYDYPDFRLMDEKVKRANVAFKEDFLFRKIEEAGFRFSEKLPGFWCGREREKCLDFQDILVLKASKH